MLRLEQQKSLPCRQNGNFFVIFIQMGLKTLPWKQGSWGQHGAHLGPTGPRWAPCWLHERCYLGENVMMMMMMRRRRRRRRKKSYWCRGKVNFGASVTKMHAHSRFSFLYTSVLPHSCWYYKCRVELKMEKYKIFAQLISYRNTLGIKFTHTTLYLLDVIWIYNEISVFEVRITHAISYIMHNMNIQWYIGIWRWKATHGTFY